MRKCKKCKVNKEFIYFTLNSQGRCVYRDATGAIWHGKTCYDCFKSYVKRTSGKKHLKTKECVYCQNSFEQKNLTQRFCKIDCRNLFKKLETNISVIIE